MPIKLVFTCCDSNILNTHCLFQSGLIIGSLEQWWSILKVVSLLDSGPLGHHATLGSSVVWHPKRQLPSRLEGHQVNSHPNQSFFFNSLCRHISMTRTNTWIDIGDSISSLAMARGKNHICIFLFAFSFPMLWQQQKSVELKLLFLLLLLLFYFRLNVPVSCIFNGGMLFWSQTNSFSIGSIFCVSAALYCFPQVDTYNKIYYNNTGSHDILTTNAHYCYYSWDNKSDKDLFGTDWKYGSLYR